jgi:hypothetical protein
MKMMTTRVLGVVVALVVSLVGGPAGAQEDEKAPKGMSVRNAVTSLGPFSATVSAPILVTGTTVVLEPGGRTGRQQYVVPTYVYVVDGTLVTDYEAGPAGIKGAQYHAAGQSFMDNGGWWHNYFNRSTKPVTVLLVHIGYPGRPDPIQKADAE